MRSNRPEFMKIDPKRKRVKNAEGAKTTQPRVRQLFVLDEQHWVLEMKAIVNQSRDYKATLTRWKEYENCIIIGHARDPYHVQV
ncbi:hypothetical protein VTP01DRAFT_314 [Rhizomucor pusillus]|uniref:uncharacterized protein n=1 Tax=Rhizomucor pusillus TaxID=4840 RepID=UPI00374202C1